MVAAGRGVYFIFVNCIFQALVPGTAQQANNGECTYTISVPASQIEASCGGPRLMQEVEELRMLEQELRGRTDEMQQQILFLVKEYEQMAQVVQTVQQETESWRQIVSWPSYDPNFGAGDPGNVVEGQEYIDCYQALKKTRSNKEGIYMIKPSQAPRPFTAYCDSDGWLVFLRRIDGSVEFDRNWSDYSGGFGELTGEYWVGLENLHHLTSASRNYELRMEGLGYNNKLYTANYDDFEVGSEEEEYSLTRLSNMTDGNVMEPDEMAALVGSKFTTKDRDNDNWDRGNCASHYFGGWWQDNCGFSPTRRYCNGAGSGCMGWNDITLKKVILKIRPMSAKGVELNNKNPRKTRKLKNKKRRGQQS